MPKPLTFKPLYLSIGLFSACLTAGAIAAMAMGLLSRPLAYVMTSLAVSGFGYLGFELIWNIFQIRFTQTPSGAMRLVVYLIYVAIVARLLNHLLRAALLGGEGAAPPTAVDLAVGYMLLLLALLAYYLLRLAYAWLLARRRRG